MAVLIVTYDLNKEPSSADYESILRVIKSGKNWAKLSESSYAVDTSKTPKQLFDEIRPYLDPGDCLMVLTVNSPYFGQHRPKVVDWLAGKM